MIFPHSTEAEKAVLGSLLLDTELIYQAMTKLSEKDFYLYFHKRIFKICKTLYKQNIAIDTVTVLDCLDKEEQTANLSFKEQITEILNSVATSSHFTHYLNILKEKTKLRNLRTLASKIKDDVEANQNYDDIRFEIDQVLKDHEISNNIKNIVDIGNETLSYFEERHSNKVTDLMTGIVALDNLFEGFTRGSLNVIAADTGAGKTTLAINVAENIARRKKNVLIFSLEMDAVDIVHKMLSNHSKIPTWKLKKAYLSRPEHERYLKEIENLTKLNINICDDGGVYIDKLEAMIKAEHSRSPLDLIVVDYLQLIRSHEFKNNKSLQIGDITKTLKGIARKLKTHIILISQLNRDGLKQNRKPLLTDLKESSSIEQDADNVLFVWHELNQQNTEIILAKNRHGQTGNINIIFDGNYSVFRSLN